MSGIRVRKPGISTTVQDLGRRGFQKFGVPVSGAMDALSLRLANLLVGNAEGAACLETTILGPTLEFSAARDFAVTGACAPLLLDGVPVPMNERLRADAGSVLEVLPVQSGARSYLAFAGGLDTRPALGSRATYARAALGGFHGRRLREGDELAFGEPEPCAPFLGPVPERLLRRPAAEAAVRVMAGPEAALFGVAGMDALTGAAYKVSGDSDRMGYRLEGPALARAEAPEMLSSAVCFGTVQVPPSGKPIVMMADRQTCGGYPRIANVISVDLGLLAQVPPGGSVRFELVTPAESRVLLLDEESALSAFAASRAAARPASAATASRRPKAEAATAPQRRNYRVTVDGVAYDVTMVEL